MLTKKLTMALTVLAILAVVAFAQQQRETTVNLEGGYVAVLNPDSTWQYKQPPLEDPKNDIIMLMRDNRYLWLKVSDYTYTFTRTMPKVKNRLEIPAKLPPLAVTGLGQNPDLDRAQKIASADVYTKATTQLRSLLPKTLPKDAQAYLTACIKDEVKEHELESNYNPGWKVETKINISNHRVRKIMECLELQLEPATPQ
ncbi:MAG: hypothetical protein FWB85_03795 [Chitinispirillia bacterium]|nr:hypothetical protein [Chitinispirillia bacterium]MCL2241498.1 hypothetical protein [Chitinispirillia bacterium]